MLQSLWPWIHINILVVAMARCHGVGGWVGRVAGDELSIEYCIQPMGLWELRTVVDIGSWASLCAPSPLLPSCFWHDSDPERGAVCCGSHLHTCHEKTAVGRHNIISAAEREGKACRAPQPLLFTLPKSSTPGHRHNGQTFFYDKNIQKLPSHTTMWVCHCMACETRSGEKLQASRSAERKFYTPGWICHGGCSLPTAVYKAALMLELCAFRKAAAQQPWRDLLFFFRGNVRKLNLV